MSEPVPADPRIGALLNLTQGLILKYGELASNVAAYLPDDVKAQLVDHTQTLMQEARDAYTEIAAMPARIDQARLSRLPEVGGHASSDATIYDLLPPPAHLMQPAPAAEPPP